MTPLVSVVITTKDRPELLKQAVASALSQSRRVDEIIVVNDGPPSGIPSDLDLSVIKLVQNDVSMGGARARNAGAARARGDILMFLDDDDEWDSEKVAAQVRCFEQHPDCVLVYSGRQLRSDKPPRKVIRRVSSKVEGNLYPRIFAANYVGVTSSVAIRKSIFDRVGGFDEALPCRQDYDLWLRICPHGEVRWDRGYHVLYTVFDDPLRQVSGRADKHAQAARYLLKKYERELSTLPAPLRRRAISEKWFSVAKAQRRSSWWQCATHAIRAFALAPNLNCLALLLPRAILARIGL